MYWELIVLRIVHVVGAIFWLGTSLFLGAFLAPALEAAGPAGGAVMQQLANRKLLTVIPTVAVLTMLAGLRLMWITSSGFSEAYFHTRSGRAYETGATLAILAFILFMSTSHRIIKKSLVLGPQIAQAPEADKPALTAQLGALRKRSAKFGAISGVLLLSAAIMMAIGRYV